MGAAHRLVLDQMTATSASNTAASKSASVATAGAAAHSDGATEAESGAVLAGSAGQPESPLSDIGELPASTATAPAQFTYTNILSAKDVEALRDHTHDVQAAWKRLKKNTNIDSAMKSLLTERGLLWEVRLCVVVIQSPGDKVLAKVHSALAGALSSEAIRERIADLPPKSPLEVQSQPLSAYVSKAAAVTSLQESMDLAGYFSNSTQSGRLTDILVPRTQSRNVNLSTRSDRAVLQAGLRRGMSITESIILMKTRTPPNPQLHPPHKKRAPDTSSVDMQPSSSHTSSL